MYVDEFYILGKAMMFNNAAKCLLRDGEPSQDDRRRLLRAWDWLSSAKRGLRSVWEKEVYDDLEQGDITTSVFYLKLQPPEARRGTEEDVADYLKALDEPLKVLWALGHPGIEEVTPEERQRVGEVCTELGAKLTNASAPRFRCLG